MSMNFKTETLSYDKKENKGGNERFLPQNHHYWTLASSYHH